MYIMVGVFKAQFFFVIKLIITKQGNIGLGCNISEIVATKEIDENVIFSCKVQQLSQKKKPVCF